MCFCSEISAAAECFDQLSNLLREKSQAYESILFTFNYWVVSLPLAFRMMITRDVIVKLYGEIQLFVFFLLPLFYLFLLFNLLLFFFCCSLDCLLSFSCLHMRSLAFLRLPSYFPHTFPILSPTFPIFSSSSPMVPLSISPFPFPLFLSFFTMFSSCPLVVFSLCYLYVSLILSLVSPLLS